MPYLVGPGDAESTKALENVPAGRRKFYNKMQFCTAEVKGIQR